jgi:very-short-patch-repair endonuclease
MTPQEVKIWQHLRTWKSDGFHFRRQHPEDGYILDFVCLRARVIVEVDGGQHGMLNGELRDKARDRHFMKQGYRVLRFWNTDVDQNLSGVLEIIRKAVAEAPTPSLRADPPPSGEG